VPHDPQLTLFDLPLDLLEPAEPEPEVLVPQVVRPQAERLAGQLSRLLSMDVRLAVTDNRSTVISYRRRPQALLLRVHHMFLGAPEPVVAALAAYAGHGDKRAGPILDGYIRQHRDRLRPPTASAPLQTRGLFHDLQELYDRLNAEFFDDRIEARITWGRLVPKGRGRRSIRMGVYLGDERLIRIHPALDRPEVPGFFVAYVVFHEMLHQAVPAECGTSRRQHHGPEFRARERAYPDYERAIAWEKQHLDLLLGLRRAHGGDDD
jgi:hypothetical protein